MTEHCKQLLELIASNPETKPLVPLFKVILELPQRTVQIFLRLLELWAELKYDRRAILVLTLMNCYEGLTVERIAQLCSVDRRTLYKSELFMRVKDELRSKRGRFPPEDDAPQGDDEE